MIDYNTERVLVTIETVQEIVPIDGADRIESARIRNWWVVVTKDMHNVGDSVLYFEIDSALPLADPRFESYRKFGVKTLPDGTEVHRLKTASMRGSFSQGTVLPSAIFANEIATVDPSDPLALQRAIRVGLWESDIDDPTLFCGDFPTHLARKSGSIRAENLTPEQWDQVIAVLQRRQLVPFLDMAYQGFGFGIEFGRTQVAYYRGDWAAATEGWERTKAVAPGAADVYFGFTGTGCSLERLRQYVEDWFHIDAVSPLVTKASNVAVVAEGLRRLGDMDHHDGAGPHGLLDHL